MKEVIFQAENKKQIKMSKQKSLDQKAPWGGFPNALPDDRKSLGDLSALMTPPRDVEGESWLQQRVVGIFEFRHHHLIESYTVL